ncbi:MAG: hypothetical protein N2439_01370 [Anaerolineae bacterium]|nr:hypothetical protein [Anaerolineae bacterium]
MSAAAPQRAGHGMAARYAAFRTVLRVATGCAIQWFAGGYETDRGLNGDEASHFVNALLVHGHVREGRFGNPLASALDCHVHFPRVAFGHWPPFCHALPAAGFSIIGRAGGWRLRRTL